MTGHILEGLALISIVGFFGIMTVEWFASPKGFERFIDPIYRKVINRYEYVQRRNRT